MNLAVELKSDELPIKFDSGCACSTFTRVFALWNNLVFQIIFLQSFQILSWILLRSFWWWVTNRVRLKLSLINFYWSYCTLKEISFPDLSLSSSWNFKMSYRSSFIWCCWPTFTGVIALWRNKFSGHLTSLQIRKWKVMLWLRVTSFWWSSSKGIFDLLVRELLCNWFIETNMI